MKSKMFLFLSVLIMISIDCLNGFSLLAQTGAPDADAELNAAKTLTDNSLIFGYSYPTSNNKLVLNGGSISITYTSAGWFRDDGSHSTTNPNYLAGFSSNSFRNFFSFDLSGINVPITSAELQIQKFTSVPATGYSVWQLFDVTSSFESINTNYSLALGNLSAGTVIYNDFGTGVPYGNDTIDGSLPSNTIISTVLNSSAITDLNAAIGGSFIIGGTSDINFPHLPPTATTILATNVQSSDATLNGIVNARGTQTTVSFKYGTTPGILLSEIMAAPNTLSGSISVSVSASINGLTGNTTYYFQVTAVNTDLTVADGQEETFTTSADLINPQAPVSPTPQNFCSSATISNLEAQPPMGCIVLWYDSPTGGILLANSFELLSGTTYYAESFESTLGLSSTGRTAVAVMISDAPVPIISGPGIGCIIPESSTFTTEPGMQNYAWSVSAGGTITSGGGITDNSISVIWNIPGLQSISVNYTNENGCNGTEPTVFPVNVIQQGTPAITGNNSVCNGAADVVYTTDPGMNSYEWSVSYGGIITSGELTNSITILWKNEGDQTVSVNYSNPSGCSTATSAIFPVTVHSLPVPQITGPTQICVTTDLYTYTTDPGMINYTWAITSGGVIESGAHSDQILVSWINPGEQQLSISYTSLEGCNPAEPAILKIQAGSRPDSAQVIMGATEVCAGSSGIYYSVSPVLYAESYIWNLPEGALITSGTGTNSILVHFSHYAVSGEITVYGYNSCGAGGVSDPFYVTVNEIPSAPEITISGDLLQSSAFEGNQWYINGSMIPGATGQEYQVTQNGSYWSVVTIGECHSDPSNTIDFLLTGIKETEKSGFQVYPVPNDGQFTVKISTPDKSDSQILVYNKLGVVIYEMNPVPWDANSSYFVDLRSFCTGTYAVVLQNDKYHFIKSMLINK